MDLLACHLPYLFRLNIHIEKDRTSEVVVFANWGEFTRDNGRLDASYFPLLSSASYFHENLILFLFIIYRVVFSFVDRFSRFIYLYLFIVLSLIISLILVHIF